MLFNSFAYLAFFPAVVALYYLTPQRWRWALLLAASYYFYGCWKVAYLGLIVASTLVDYVVGLGLGRAGRRRDRRLLLAASLGVNLGLLFAFKYWGFFAASTTAVLRSFNVAARFPELDVLLPVGISFYTFQTLSYTIDVYKGQRAPERHLGVFAVYVAFFPQLVAGPIERSTHLLPQFLREHRFDSERLWSGLRLMLWGMVKKVVIADRLALSVDRVYGDVPGHEGVALLLASVMFGFQIYCDFSGYSDLAIGSARVLGFDLMTNFRQPYFSSSIREFWQRWHISLSTWFRDYVYIPLGGSRHGRARLYLNLCVTFLVSGLWHGANWTFVVWGGLHGLFLATSLLTARLRAGWTRAAGLDRAPGLLTAWRILATNALVTLAWVFFRADSVTEAVAILERMGGGLLDTGAWARVPAVFGGGADLAFLGVMVAALSAYDWALWRGVRLLDRPPAVLVDVSLQFWILVVFGVFANQQFIYFQF
jgi:D-alanyl-lipoteichoic acid acyltransferase DltB (MBOAT superfamily)